MAVDSAPSESPGVWECAMLGSPKPRRLDAPVVVSLEALVPPSTVYRPLAAKLALRILIEWTRGLYAARERPRVDPVVCFQLQVVMFFAGIRSERKLIATASLTLAPRWSLGYALDEALPDHASRTRNGHRPAPTSARRRSASVLLTPMPPQGGPSTGRPSATTTMTSLTAASGGSSWPRSSPPPMSWRTCRCATCCDGSASAERSGRGR